MAVNSSRSMTADLREGATDGKYRKLRPNTGGDSLNAAVNSDERASLNPLDGYGARVEASVKILPDGTKA
jgi:hypothetical protein